MTETAYRYLLDVEIPATEVAVILDALEESAGGGGEAFGLRDRLGAAELRRQIEAQRIHVDARSATAWPDFQRDIETLSTYLSEPIAGHELRLERGAGGEAPVASGAVILARRGKVQHVPLRVAWDADQNELTEQGVLAEPASAAWTGLPDWVRGWLTNRGAAPRRD
jgi:hypothetical protein